MSSSDKSDDPYKFWAMHKGSFRNLSMVAQQILSAPATSSSCERCFSMANIFVEPHKSNISPETLNAKLILATNKDLIQQFDLIE